MITINNNSNDWYLDAIFYQIYPQSFYDSNNDGIGDLKGIEHKLDYLVDLGVDAIWLNPIFKSPFRDAGYDISDYKLIAPRYGSMKQFEQLIKACHQRNIRILLDYVANHTSIDHPWFIESAKKNKNRYSKWYVWHNNPLDYGKGNWVKGIDGRYDCFYSKYFVSMPELNYGNPDLNPDEGNSPDDQDVWAMREEMKSVVRFWFDKGVDGLRCDVPSELVEEIGCPTHHPRTAEFWRELRAICNQYPGRAIIAEESAMPTLVVNEWGFHMSFDFQSGRKIAFTNSPASYLKPNGEGDPVTFDQTLRKNTEAVIDHKGALALTTGSHDKPRLASVVSGVDDLCILAILLVLTQNAVPFIYYGDEIGMHHNFELPSKEGARQRVGARTPMQWNDTQNAGFSKTKENKLYLPVNNDYRIRNTAIQEASSNSILNETRKIIAVRRQHPALTARGRKTTLYAKKNDPVYVYLRSYEDERIIIALNPSPKKRRIRVSLGNTGFEDKRHHLKYLAKKEGCWQEAQILAGHSERSLELALSPFTYVILKLEQ